MGYWGTFFSKAAAVNQYWADMFKGAAVMLLLTLLRVGLLKVIFNAVLAAATE